jgi:hypothetical protein
VYDRDLIVKTTAANLPTTGVFDGGAFYVTDTSFPSGATVPQASARGTGEGLYIRDGGRVNPPHNLPFGIMGYWSTTTNIVSPGTALVLVTGSSTSWSHQASRWIQGDLSVRAQNNGVSTQQVGVYVIDDGANTVAAGFIQVAASTQTPIHLTFASSTFTAGTRTLGLYTSIGASTVTILSTTGARPHFIVNDIGPSSSPV